MQEHHLIIKKPYFLDSAKKTDANSDENLLFTIFKLCPFRIDTHFTFLKGSLQKS